MSTQISGDVRERDGGMAPGTGNGNGRGQGRIEIRSPLDGAVVGSVPEMGATEVEAAVRKARFASRHWGNLTFGRRRQELEAFRRALAAETDDLVDLIHRENGKPRLDALLEMMLALSHLDWAASNAEKVLATRKVSAGIMANFRATVSYAPLGVVAVIGPWNYPIFTPIGSIGCALAAGNTVVFKPSEFTPLVGQKIGEIAARSLGIADVLQVVTGSGATGAALARSAVDKIAFTGSTATGKKIMAAAAERLTPVLMELGGKDAMVVAEDADLDKAAESAVFGALTNAGQACISVERVYVPAPIYDRFVDRVVAEARRVEVGREGHIGAMTTEKQVDIVREQLVDAEKQGARALTGGAGAISGRFIAPTVLVDVTDDMKVMKDETFGPVLPIIKVRDTEEAIERANQSPYGLASTVFGKRGVREIADRLRAGMTSINSWGAVPGIPSLPFGGVGESGFGRTHGAEGLREFARLKSTAEQVFSLPMNLMSFWQPAGTYEKLRGMITTLYGGGAVDKVKSTLAKLW
jgi:acyl-CoA reductase-like NAD-dependent aldehyde dehydrogenase